MPQVGFAIAGLYAAATATAIGSFLVNTAMSMAFSALSQALAGRPKSPGIRTDVTMAGENTPGSLVFGRYATAGFMAAPPMTRGNAGGAPNGFLTYVIELADIPITSLDGIWIGDEYCEILPPVAGSLYPDHNAIGGRYAGHAWFRFFNGTRTTAYAGLTAHDEWREDMIGRGLPFVVMRFRFNREVFQGLPPCLFEVTGIPLYDPRRDSTVGGTGSHRWGSRSTHEPSENPAVQIYNILRGIRYEGEHLWGGRASAEDLPLDNWIAAMNACDQLVDGAPRWRSSFEAKIGPENLGGDEPASVIEEILRGCSGAIAEFGGAYRIRIGGVGMPVAVFSDDDVIISEGQSLEPFKGLDQIYNTVHAQYPDPVAKWQPKEAPPRRSAAYIAEDGDTYVASLSLPATPYPGQVQRVMRAYLLDSRRQRQIDLTLPPDFAAVELLDAVAWTSARNGFAAKVFEVTGRGDHPLTLAQGFSLRERDAGDYVWTPDMELPSVVGGPTTPIAPPRVVLDFAVAPTVTIGPDGVRRRAGIEMTWNGDQPDARALRYQIRQQGQTETFGGSIHAIPEGVFRHFENILPNVTYEVRARLVTERATVWTAWLPVTTGAAGFSWDDWDEALREEIEAALGLIPAAIQNANQVRLEADQISAMLAGSARRLWEELNAVRDGALEGQFGEFLARQTLRSELLVEVGNARASFADQIDVIITEQAALSLRATSLQSQFESTTAAYGLDLITLADGQRALAGSLQEFQTQVATSNAQVIQQIGALSQAQQSTASRLDQVSAAVGTTGATAGTLATAIAEIQGALRAGYLIRAQAGGAASSIELIAADGSGGRPTSIVRLSGDEILLDGSVSMQKLAITGTRTLVHDPEYRALDSWFGSPPRTVVTTSNLDFWGGPRVLSLTAEANVRSRIISAKVPVEPRQTVRADVPISATNSARQGSIRLMFYATSGQSMGSPTATVAAPDATSAQQVVSVEAVVPAGCAFMALEYFTPSASGTNSVRFGYPLLRILDAYNLIISGGAVADFISTRDLAALNARFSDLAAARIRVGDAEIDTLQIAGNAVTVQWSSNSFGLNINVPHPTKIMVFTSARIMGTFQTHNTRYSLRRNGAEIDSVVFSVDEYTNPYLQMRAFSIPAGQHQFEFDYTRVSGSSTTTNYNTGRIAIFGAFR